MAGTEFCSDAHRREYQQEYSQLALGRLLQSKPAEPEKPPAKAEPALVVSEPAPTVSAGGKAKAPQAQPSPALVSAVAPRVANPPPMLIRSEKKPSPAAPPTAPKSNGSAPAWQMPPATPVVSEPAMAKPASILKPVPAKFQLAVAVAEFDGLLSTLTVDRPIHHANMSPAELPAGASLRWEHGVEMADAAVHPMESNLDLREPPRTTPRVQLDLGILAEEPLEIRGPSLAMPAMAGIAPPEAALWIAPHGDFTDSVVSLDQFATSCFSSIGLEEIPLAGTHALMPQAPVETLNATFPAPVLEPQAVETRGIAAGKPKPVPVFGSALFSSGPVQVPQPSGLPLRPTMILGPAPNMAVTPQVSSKNRKPDVRILPPAPVSVKPTLQVAKTPASSSTEPDLGLPELKLQSPAGAGVSRIRKILFGVAGAAAIGVGMLIFFGSKSDAGSKQPAPTTVREDPWIANFAADPHNQRKVSVLRSTTGLAAYRVEFESAIQIKGLGWVYRAQNAKNFYVSKIELKRPGQNPAFVMVHYAVINGVDQPRVEVPLHVAVPLGGVYKIRFTAVGDRFTTWVQDQQVDQWTDTRLKTGGAGLFNEGAEQSLLKGEFRVIPLVGEK